MRNLILIFLPVALIQLSLQIYCLVDLFKRPTVRFNNKALWAVIILLGSLLGAIVYLVLREDPDHDSY